MKQSLLCILIASVVVLSFGYLVNSHKVLASHEDDPAYTGCPGNNLQGPVAPGVECPGDHTAGELDADCETFDDCGIVKYLGIFINVLSAAVGIVIVIMIAVGGIQYSMSRDNPQGVAAARQRIFNALLALVVYMGMVAFLQWIVPGGVFS